MAALEHVLCHPLGERRVGEGITEAFRCAVGRVRIPDINVQEPLFAAPVALQPVERQPRHLVGVFHAGLAGIDDLAEAGIPVPAAVPFAEARDCCGVIVEIAQSAHPAFLVEGSRPSAFRALAEWLACRAAMADDAGAHAVPSAPQRGARGMAGHVGDINVLEAHAVARQAVDHRGRIAMVSVAAEMVAPEAVDVDVENVHG